MPEGHVLHRLAGELNRRFAGKVLEISSPQGRFQAEANLLQGVPFDHAEAYGKQLFLHFATPQPERIIFIHLGLIGKFRFYEHTPPAGIIRLQLVSDDTYAVLTGPQWCRLIDEPTREQAIRKLGADPLRASSDPGAIWPRIKRSSRPFGELLMDQSLFAGVGNIYRAEVLFRAGIAPKRKGKRILRREFDAVYADLVELMALGVRDGRIDTVRPAHLPEAMGRPPRDDAHGGEVYVYRRAGEPCYVCGTPIRHEIMGNRNLFYCPTCQH
ncbi:Fpg/Nei family DNA glycosylase [Corynebacterium choanae]|nr:DNA-formamidopyrimidine glycosylase family protein [Corynebacterium choanae]